MIDLILNGKGNVIKFLILRQYCIANYLFSHLKTMIWDDNKCLSNSVIVESAVETL